MCVLCTPLFFLPCTNLSISWYWSLACKKQLNINILLTCNRPTISMLLYRVGNNSQTSDIFWSFHAFVWSKDYLVCHYVWAITCTLHITFNWRMMHIISCLNVTSMAEQDAQTNLLNIRIWVTISSSGLGFNYNLHWVCHSHSPLLKLSFYSHGSLVSR